MTDEQATRLGELTETLSSFKTLVASRGWAALLEIAKVQAHTRRHRWAYTPLEDINKVSHQQFELGEASGIDAIMAIPEKVIEDYSTQLKELHNQMENANVEAE